MERQKKRIIVRAKKVERKERAIEGENELEDTERGIKTYNRKTKKQGRRKEIGR